MTPDVGFPRPQGTRLSTASLPQTRPAGSLPHLEQSRGENVCQRCEEQQKSRVADSMANENNNTEVVKQIL